VKKIEQELTLAHQHGAASKHPRSREGHPKMPNEAIKKTKKKGRKGEKR